jgi:hypothetical protein
VRVDVERGQDDDAGDGGILAGEPRGRRDAVQARHPDVHQRDVRPQASRRGHGLDAVGGLAGHRDVGLGGQDEPEAGADHRLVVGEQHPDHGALVDAGSAAGTGSTACTANPPPGRGPASTEPEYTAARSRMPTSPWPPASGAAAPRPSSRTSSSTDPSR